MGEGSRGGGGGGTIIASNITPLPWGESRSIKYSLLPWGCEYYNINYLPLSLGFEYLSIKYSPSCLGKWGEYSSIKHSVMPGGENIIASNINPFPWGLNIWASNILPHAWEDGENIIASNIYSLSWSEYIILSNIHFSLGCENIIPSNIYCFRGVKIYSIKYSLLSMERKYYSIKSWSLLSDDDETALNIHLPGHLVTEENLYLL